jgi:hypothetical protein
MVLPIPHKMTAQGSVHTQDKECTMAPLRTLFSRTSSAKRSSCSDRICDSRAASSARTLSSIVAEASEIRFASSEDCTRARFEAQVNEGQSNIKIVRIAIDNCKACLNKIAVVSRGEETLRGRDMWRDRKGHLSMCTVDTCGTG